MCVLSWFVHINYTYLRAHSYIYAALRGRYCAGEWRFQNGTHPADFLGFLNSVSNKQQRPRVSAAVPARLLGGPRRGRTPSPTFADRVYLGVEPFARRS